MRYLVLFLTLISFAQAQEGIQKFIISAGANIVGDYEAHDEAGIIGKFGTEIGFNDQTDLGVHLNVSKASLSTGHDFWQYGLSFVSFYTPYFGDVRPRMGALMGFQQVYNEANADPSNYVNLGVAVQSYFDFRGTSDMFIEAQPGILMGSDNGFSYINLSFGFTFGGGN